MCQKSWAKSSMTPSCESCKKCYNVVTKRLHKCCSSSPDRGARERGPTKRERDLRERGREEREREKERETEGREKKRGE